MKKCNKCLEIKSFDEFGIEGRSKNGYKPRCKKCTNEYYNSLYDKFKENKLKKAKIYYAENKEYLKTLRINYTIDKDKKSKYNKVYNILNKEKINKLKNEYEKNKIKNDSNYRFIRNVRRLVRRTIEIKTESTFDLLGYSKNDLLKSLGKYPEQGESIDHKVPVSWFIEYSDIKLINHLENLQILTTKDNLIKSNTFAHKISKNYYELIKNTIKPKYLNKINYGE